MSNIPVRVRAKRTIRPVNCYYGLSPNKVILAGTEGDELRRDLFASIVHFDGHQKPIRVLNEFIIEIGCVDYTEERLQEWD